MIEIREKLPRAEPAGAVLTLPFEVRQRSRFRACLDDGRDVGVILTRGSVLRGGDCLRAVTGQVVQVRAAAEPVSTVRARNTLDLARACYHLGNRHVPLQIGDSWARYLCDHVLDAMLRELGLYLDHEQAPFEPESGAYGHGHSHGHHEHD